ncbi:MAG: TadE family protein [Fuerstiella sp.]
MRRQKKSNHPSFRDGAAAVEFAVCLPMLLVILIGVIEASSMIYLKQSLSVAAYEGIRASVKAGATTSDVEAACNQILTARRVNGATIEITPSNFEDQPALSWISVRVSATGGDNSVIAGWFYDTLVVDGQAAMMKEY